MIKRVALMLAGLAFVFGSGAARADEVLARYALFAHDPINDRTMLLVRAVIDGDGTACPVLTVDAEAVPMIARHNPDSARFPVTVCEAAAPPTSAVSLGADAVPTLRDYAGGDLHLVMFGDTGCKGGARQDCATQWPFGEMAKDAAAGEPDVVLHVGDWDYLGTPHKSADGKTAYDGCMPAGETALTSLAELSDWSTWREDVFTPAAPLFEAAPWIVTRGNHELCSRAGQGWFYLLDPHSTLLDPYHGEPRCDAPMVTTDPYPIEVGDLSVIVADNVNACDNPDWQNDAAWAYQTRALAPMIDRIEQLAGRISGPVWVVTHRPLWAAVRFEENGPLIDGSLAWRLALKASLGGTLPDNVAMVVSGHVHDAQALVFDGARPPQLIVGNGGTVLDENYVARPVDVELDGLATTGWIAAIPDAKHGYGYLDAIVHDAADWRARMPAFQPDGTAAGVDIMDCAMPLRDGALCAEP